MHPMMMHPSARKEKARKEKVRKEKVRKEKVKENKWMMRTGNRIRLTRRCRATMKMRRSTIMRILASFLRRFDHLK